MFEMALAIGGQMVGPFVRIPCKIDRPLQWRDPNVSPFRIVAESSAS